MCEEPALKSARVFVDGQNLYHQAKEAFGYYYPNYDILKLSNLVCKKLGYSLCGVNFYTGVPLSSYDELWASFWNKKLSRMSRTVRTFSLPLKYSLQTTYKKDQNGDTVEKEVQVGREKGIDIRIAIDMLKVCRNKSCNVAIIFSQDQDLLEAVKEARAISHSDNRWFKLVSAFPVSSSSSNKRGINQTDWCTISKEEYDQCIDEFSYFERTAD